MQRILFTVAYEGGAYAGWQRQPSCMTIQQIIEEAFEQMTGLPGKLAGAGRTDAGVHAAAQVFVMDNTSRHDAAALLKGMNAILPDDVVLRSAKPVDDNFDPRRQAVGKHYRYTIHQGEIPHLFHRRLRWHFRMELDRDLMEREAQCLLGEHDFSAFRGAGCGAKSPVRRIDHLSLRRRGACLELDVLGQSFLKHMVRNIMGSLVEVGRSYRPAGWLSQVLAGRDRTQAGPTAPPQGLCLMRVFYESPAYVKACREPEQGMEDVFCVL